MTIKSMSRKQGIRQLIDYIFRDEISDVKGVMQLKHNLSGSDRDRWVKQMEFNHSLRKVKTKKSIQVYHEIISFHKDDSNSLTRKMLLEIGKKYIELRGKNNQVIMREHQDKNHRHIHVAMAATELLTGKASRISKKEFAKFRIEMERFQKEKYPELIHSIVYTKSKEGLEHLKENRAARKDKMKGMLDSIFKDSKTQEEFIKHLKTINIEPYYRGGKLVGVLDAKDTKFRFSNLGFDVSKFEEIDSKQTELDKKLDELDETRNNKKEEVLERETIQNQEEETTDEDDDNRNE